MVSSESDQSVLVILLGCLGRGKSDIPGKCRETEPADGGFCAAEYPLRNQSGQSFFPILHSFLMVQTVIAAETDHNAGR